MHSAMSAQDSSGEACPTVDPGLRANGKVRLGRREVDDVDSLKVVQLQSKQLASLQVV